MLEDQFDLEESRSLISKLSRSPISKSSENFIWSPNSSSVKVKLRTGQFKNLKQTF